MVNLSSLLEGSAQAHPDRTAVVLGDKRLTYAQVDAAANQVANLLVARGIEPGDKVALSCPNLPYFPIVYYGILKAGATVVLVESAGQLLGALAIRDELRPEAAEAVAALHRMGISTSMLTGDNPRTAAHLAAAAGIDQVHAELRPEDKATLVEQLGRRGRATGRDRRDRGGDGHRARRRPAEGNGHDHAASGGPRGGGEPREPVDEVVILPWNLATEVGALVHELAPEAQPWVAIPRMQRVP